MPSWPQAATGAVAFVHPTEQIYASAGFFDGSITNGNNVGRLGPAPLFRGQEFFYIGEAGFTWSDVGSLGRGRVAAGAWHTTGDLTRFDATTQDSTTGLYLVAEQQLWWRGENSSEDPKGLWIFTQLGHTDEDVAAIADHLGVGASFYGPLEQRPDDRTGVYISRAGLSGDPAAGLDGDETAFELFYRFHFTPFASLRPSVYFINNPGGGTVDDAVVGMLRFEISF